MPRDEEFDAMLQEIVDELIDDSAEFDWMNESELPF